MIGIRVYLMITFIPLLFGLRPNFNRKVRADSSNGFDFGGTSMQQNLKGLDYGTSQRMRRMFDIIKSKRDNTTGDGIDDKRLSINVPYDYIRKGYPRQSYMNLTIGKLVSDDPTDEQLDDVEDELDSKLESQMRKMLNLPAGVKIYRVDDPNMVNSYDPRTTKRESGPKKSENFEVVENSDHDFDSVGGYEQVKGELMQTVDILKNYEKYKNYSVRIPKGLLLEGPPGNGKTLLAKAFSGEVNSAFIAVSGSQFTEKYVGVGAGRIRELFKLAEENTPCIIFIDEIDALGRSRTSNDQVQNPNTEAQSTLNELLVRMDGYKSSEGVFIVAATNRGDLLDPALLRPGRIDKRVYIGNPDAKTREHILNIHTPGKPYDKEITIDDLVEMTNGLSGAQIENLLNEGMLFALRNDRTMISREDLETILSRMLVGYQSTENSYSDDMIKRIAIHELGHAIVGIFSLHHANLVKICLNAWSPTSPGYTIFETAETDSSIYTKEKLASRLMVLLSGRIAEEVFFGASITSGASKDIEDAYLLAEQMIVKFGMGRKIVYPHHSEHSKNFIDKDIETLIEVAYKNAREIIVSKKDLIEECSNELIEKKILSPEAIFSKLNSK